MTNDDRSYFSMTKCERVMAVIKKVLGWEISRLSMTDESSMTTGGVAMTASMTRTVTIPACDNHDGVMAVRVTLPWVCPVCGGPRGEPVTVRSYDGSRILSCDGWVNPCGHVDKYAAVRAEYALLRAGQAQP